MSYTIIPALLLVFNEALKKAGLDSKYIPLINIVLGAIMGMVVDITTKGSINITSAIMGIMAGTSSGGIYDFVKKK